MRGNGKPRFDRAELAGSFGDIGTDMPLIVGMILACGLDSASVLILFGLMQVFSGLAYGLPMPVQPLKAVAVIMISSRLDGGVLYGGGLAIGAAMLLLTVSGLLDWMTRVVPRCVVRGIQVGLGVSLARMACVKYLPADGTPGLILAAAALAALLALRGNRRFPAALAVMGLGAAYAAAFKVDPGRLLDGAGLVLPRLHVPVPHDVLQGFLLLGLAQIPLSISNSVVATRQTVADLFPGYPISVRKIGWTYSLMNLVAPFFGGIPTCHGAGGLAGHYAFGARTGGSVIMYGALYLTVGLCFSASFEEVLKVFPLPILGVVLLNEGLTLAGFAKDILASRKDLVFCALTAAAAVFLGNGYLVGMLGGTVLWHLADWEAQRQA